VDEEAGAVTELTQTLVNAVLLIAVTLIAGSIGLKRFEAIDRRFEAIDRRFEAIDRRFEALDGRFDAVDGRFDAVDRRFDELRTELRADIARVDGHVVDLRSEIAQVRSDLTYVALAVGARRAEGSA
jgi:chromosome segregation ATPase